MKKLLILFGFIVTLATMLTVMASAEVIYYSGMGNEGETIREDLEGDNDITLTVNGTNYFGEYGFVANEAEGVFDGAVKTDGFSIRLKDYNGLRTIFTFDKNKNSAFENKGYELLEYGAVVVSEKNYINDGSVVTINGETRELTTSGRKVTIWEDGKTVGNILGEKDGIISYCVAIVNYEANHADNIYYAAYSIYRDPDGEIVVTVSPYSNDNYKAISLYQTTLDMYVNGAVSSKNSDDAAVWNTLLTGVVTLTEGTDYVESDAFGDTFTMKEFSACGKTEVSTIKLTVVNDPKNNSLVLIYRGSGEIPGTAWDKHQLAAERSADYLLTNPKLSSSSEDKIKKIVIDYGITGVNGSHSFAQFNFDTLVYPETFETFNSSYAFYHCLGMTTAYMSIGDGVMREVESGLVDFSNIDSFSGTNMFYNSYRIPAKLHLPATIGTVDTKFFYGSTGRATLKKVWCGNTPEPADGVIDLSESVLVSIGELAFDDFTALHTLIIPDTCTSIHENAFSDSGNKYITKIMQKNYDKDIAEYCDTNGIIYCNLKGEEHTAP